MFDASLAINRRFIEFEVETMAERRILEGVMLLDEYRLYHQFQRRPDASLVVDVGGHYGSFTAMAKILWPMSRVLAYEPCHLSADRYRAETASITGVELIEAACVSRAAACNTTVMLYLNEDCASNTLIAGQGLVGSETVATSSLINDLERRGSPGISILKLDCEGSEGELLQDLHDANYMIRVEYICGEWHGEKNAAAIENLLPRTHSLTLHRHEWPWGAFFAQLL